MGQVAQRMKGVEFVDHDTMKNLTEPDPEPPKSSDWSDCPTCGEKVIVGELCGTCVAKQGIPQYTRPQNT